MDKKQIDYAKLNQERIITIADLIRAIIRKLWVVVAAAVIFAAIFWRLQIRKRFKSCFQCFRVYNRYESEAG